MMLNKLVKYIDIQKLKRFILSFTLFILIIMSGRLLTTETLDFSRDLGYVAGFSLLFALITGLWNYNRKHLLLCFVFIGIYVLVALLKRCTGMILQEREITHTIGLALILFAIFSWVRYTALYVKNGALKLFLEIGARVLCVLFILPALIFLGYAAVNHGLFSSDIMLTLFQTNPEEVIAYLQDRNLWHWGLGTVCIIIFVVLFSSWFLALKSDKFSVPLYILTFVWLIYCSCAVLPKLNLCLLVNIVQTTKATLDGFDEFKQSQNERISRLKNLMINNKLTSDSGLYVLVIGESETKDHMQLYGYDRKTTPWLSEFSLNKNTFVFNNAYANHTHTVPTLTYALSEKNQYNDVDVNDVFSLVEVAEAAGYKTYWFSNQAKYGVLETPITTIAALADEQYWLNTNTGDKLFTSYYDEKLVDAVPDVGEEPKVLLIVHLMGNHAAYRDRYPTGFRYFKGKGRNPDAYDNSVLYNDYVLQKIYNKVRNYPNFMAWVYFSDHGDDVDAGVGHESSRFTYPMARIPLVVNVSDKFAEEREEQTDNMRKHINAFWTNDLVYDLMVNLMGIKGLPNMDDKYDLLSADYELPRDEVKLLHGDKTLQDEKGEF